MIEVYDYNFKQQLARGHIILMFYTDWCPMCPYVSNICERLENDYTGRFLLVKINKDHNPTAVAEYDAIGVPYIFALKDGELKGVFPGCRLEEYDGIVKALLTM